MSAPVNYQMALNPFCMPAYVDPQAAVWSTGVTYPDSNVLTNMAANFSRYRVHGLKFHYLPMVGTDEDISFSFAYSGDPAHPLCGMAESAAADYPTFTRLDNCTSSITFPAWEAWSLACTTDFMRDYYTAFTPKYGTASTTIYSHTLLRDSCFGSISLLADAKGDTGAVFGRFGELWWDLDIEFFDANPIISTIFLPPTLEAEGPQILTLPVPLRRTTTARAATVPDLPPDLLPVESKDRKSESDEDLDFPAYKSIPRTGLPTGYPGSSTYAPRNSLPLSSASSSSSSSSLATPASPVDAVLAALPLRRLPTTK